MAASGLRIAPRQRDVDVADLVDLKALADRFDAAERLEQRAQAIAGEAEDLEVDVARLGQAEQPVAHPAADNQRAAAGVTDGGGDAVDGRHRHVRQRRDKQESPLFPPDGFAPEALHHAIGEPGASALRITSARDLACG